jgi:dTDP-4-amino-4,6-dideoxygalactose transaminase
MLLVAEPVLGEEEKAALREVVDSGWITTGDRVAGFERAFADLHGASDAVAVSSCTAGLHLVLQSLGIGPGDEVLVPSLTFVATANSVVYCGAEPVFVDIGALDQPVISCADAAAKCTARTKAVVVMHYGGYLADGPAWRAFAQSRGLALVEDSAHAVGAGRAGLFADAAVFSFFGNKNMTTAEGGMVVARDPALLERVRRMRAHGMTASTLDRLNGQALTYDVTMLGYNYRMDDLRAAIGLVQLRHLDGWNWRRETLTKAYRQMLAMHCPTVRVPFATNQPSAHHILPALLPKGTVRQRVMARMRDSGIQTTVHYPPTHLLSWYRNRTAVVHLPVTEEFAQRELTLPLHPRMDERQVDFVVRALADVLDEANADGATVGDAGMVHVSRRMSADPSAALQT